jgi:hypothetical protein
MLRTLLAPKSDGSPLNVLDVGGHDVFWRALNLSDFPEIRITFLNLYEFLPSFPNSVSMKGDARFMSAFADNQFDLVFSNSVIEHVGNLRDQKQMAEECRRVGRSHFIQTPNRYFPIEPHFLIPLFHFLPCSIRAHLHSFRDWGWWKRAPSYLSAYEEVESIRLLSERELRYLFPMSHIWKEKFFIFTKSFVAFGESKPSSPCPQPISGHV